MESMAGKIERDIFGWIEAELKRLYPDIQTSILTSDYGRGLMLRARMQGPLAMDLHMGNAWYALMVAGEKSPGERKVVSLPISRRASPTVVADAFYRHFYTTWQQILQIVESDLVTTSGWAQKDLELWDTLAGDVTELFTQTDVPITLHAKSGNPGIGSPAAHIVTETPLLPTWGYFYENEILTRYWVEGHDLNSAPVGLPLETTMEFAIQFAGDAAFFWLRQGGEEMMGRFGIIVNFLEAISTHEDVDHGARAMAAGWLTTISQILSQRR